jgi:hypothetical protein
VNLAVAKLQGRDPARLMLADLALTGLRDAGEKKLAARGVNVVAARLAHGGDDARFAQLRGKSFDRGRA